MSANLLLSVLEGKLLLVGGENSVKDLMTFVQEYTPETDRWNIFCHLPTGLKSKFVCKKAKAFKWSLFCVYTY